MLVTLDRVLVGECLLELALQEVDLADRPVVADDVRLAVVADDAQDAFHRAVPEEVAAGGGVDPDADLLVVSIADPHLDDGHAGEQAPAVDANRRDARCATPRHTTAAT